MPYIVDGETFTNRALIPIDKDFIDGNLTDWTGSFDLSVLTSAFWLKVKSDGGDIRVTLADGTTRVGLELKNFNVGSEVGQVYFLVSSVSSSVDTNFYLYWGNAGLSQPAEDAAYGKESAWPSKCKTVHHFDQDPSGSSPQAEDSTSNDKDGTSFGSMTGVDLIDSTFGKAWQTDGVDDYVEVDAGEVLIATGTIEIFFKTNFAYDDTGNPIHFFLWSFYINDSNLFYLYYDQSLDQFLVGQGTILASAVQSFASGTDFHMTVTWDSGGSPKAVLYLDGVQVSTSGSAPNFTIPTNYRICVGEFSSTLTSWSPVELMDFRQYNTSEAAEWIKANNECLSNQSNFYKAATYEESVADGDNAIFGAANF
jgi:hypothetical protein